MMPQQEPFTPVFGPNGAVMNAPGLSDEMRRKLEAQAEPLTPRKAWRGLRDIAIPTAYLAAMCLVLVLFRDQLSTEAAMLVVAIYMAGSLVIRIAGEFAGWRKRAAQRRDGVPVPPINWVVSTWVAGCLMLLGAACILLALFLPIGSQQNTLLYAAGWPTYVVGLIASAWLAKRAEKRGWV